MPVSSYEYPLLIEIPQIQPDGSVQYIKNVGDGSFGSNSWLNLELNLLAYLVQAALPKGKLAPTMGAQIFQVGGGGSI